MATMREKLLILALLVCVVAFKCAVATITDPTSSTIVSSNSTNKTASPSEMPSDIKIEKQDFGSNNSTQLSSGNKGLLNRSLYVAVGLSAVVVIYFIVRTIRTKRRKSKSKKYGVINGTGDMEMQPLEREDDDDEDLTVFDMNDRRTNK